MSKLPAVTALVTVNDPSVPTDVRELLTTPEPNVAAFKTSVPAIL